MIPARATDLGIQILCRGCASAARLSRSNHSARSRGGGALIMGARLIPAAEVALITVLEVVLAPLWVWISISEKPAQPRPYGLAFRSRSLAWRPYATRT